MTIKQEMKKDEMIATMLDNNYPEAWGFVPSYLTKKKSKNACYEWAKHYLRHHVLKTRIYEMFRNYLYWKVEQN